MYCTTDQKEMQLDPCILAVTVFLTCGDWRENQRLTSIKSHYSL